MASISRIWRGLTPPRSVTRLPSGSVTVVDPQSRTLSLSLSLSLPPSLSPSPLLVPPRGPRPPG
jgi:hypothetical protein